MTAMLKCQQFEDNRSDKTKLRGSKRQCLDEHNNEERNNLDKDKGKIEGIRYVFSPFIPLFLLLQKLSNRPSDLGKRIRSLNYLVYISKICYLRNINFVLEFSSKEDLKTSKKSILVA